MFLEKVRTGFDCIGIPIIADYLLNRLYEPEITIKQASTMATFCVKETGSQDNKVGGPTQIATFSNQLQFNVLSKEEVGDIEGKCEKFHVLDKNKFYPEDESSGSKSSKEAAKQ